MPSCVARNKLAAISHAVMQSTRRPGEISRVFADNVRKHWVGGHRGPNYWQRSHELWWQIILLAIIMKSCYITYRRAASAAKQKHSHSIFSRYFGILLFANTTFSILLLLFRFFSLIKWFNFTVWLSHSWCTAHHSWHHLTACGWINAIIHFIFCRREFCPVGGRRACSWVNLLRHCGYRLISWNTFNFSTCFCFVTADIKKKNKRRKSREYCVQIEFSLCNYLPAICSWVSWLSRSAHLSHRDAW